MVVQLEKAFSDILYNDKLHKYNHAVTGRQFTSVTQFIGRLKPKFDNPLWTTIKAFEWSGYTVKRDYKRDGIIYVSSEGTSSMVDINNLNVEEFNLTTTPQDVSNKWGFESYVGGERGSYLHNYLENLDRRQTDLPKMPDIYAYRNYIPDSLTVINYYNNLKTLETLARQFKKNTKHLIPVAIEYVVGDVGLGIAGKFDRLYYNELTGAYEIWDFKTDKKIARSNKYGKIKLFEVDDCEFEKYSVQTSLYKYIIQNNTDIELGTSNIVWFDYKNDNYEIIETNDYCNQINKLKNEYDWTTYI